MKHVQQAQWEMIEAGGRTAQSFGLNRLLGQLYTLLYLSDEPQSLDAIAAQLGVSKASASIACRQLESWGALHRVWQKGDRKDYYSAESDFSAILNNGLLASITKKLDTARIQIERSLELLRQDGGDDHQIAFLRERLKDAEKFRLKIRRIIDNPLVKRIL